MRTGPLLPTEPRVANLEVEHVLTERFLVPAAAGLEALFRALRADLDPTLAEDMPVKLGKPYPLGQCLEISRAVATRLQQLDASTLDGAPARGYAALDAFMRHGGTMRQVWGDLRGEYFQNALLIGTLYVDAANDTVVPAKPPVEILPFAEARLGPIVDYLHFSRIASRYWLAQLFPNHILPSIAPYFPLVAATPGGGMRLESTSDYMVALTITEEFRPSEAVLGGPPMNRDLFRLLAGCLAGSALDMPADAESGRALAVQACRDRRAGHPSECRRAEAVVAVLDANERLAHLRVDRKPTSAGT